MLRATSAFNLAVIAQEHERNINNRELHIRQLQQQIDEVYLKQKDIKHAIDVLENGLIAVQQHTAVSIKRGETIWEIIGGRIHTHMN